MIETNSLEDAFLKKFFAKSIEELTVGDVLNLSVIIGGFATNSSQKLAEIFAEWVPKPAKAAGPEIPEEFSKTDKSQTAKVSSQTVKMSSETVKKELSDNVNWAPPQKDGLIKGQD